MSLVAARVEAALACPRGRPWRLGSAPWPQQLASGRPVRRGLVVATRLHSPTHPLMLPPSSHLLGRRADGGSRQAAALPVALDRRRGRRSRSTPKAPPWRRHRWPPGSLTRLSHPALSAGSLTRPSQPAVSVGPLSRASQLGLAWASPVPHSGPHQASAVGSGPVPGARKERR